MIDSDLTIRVPMKFVRKGGRKLIFMPDGTAPAKMTAEPDDIIIAALLRAHMWNKALEDGKAKSATDLANKEGVNGSYMARVMRLCLLAPDIKSDILDGNHPKGLRLIDMLKPFPLVWEDQRKWFGFSR